MSKSTRDSDFINSLLVDESPILDESNDSKKTLNIDLTDTDDQPVLDYEATGIDDISTIAVDYLDTTSDLQKSQSKTDNSLNQFFDELDVDNGIDSTNVNDDRLGLIEQHQFDFESFDEENEPPNSIVKPKYLTNKYDSLSFQNMKAATLVGGRIYVAGDSICALGGDEKFHKVNVGSEFEATSVCQYGGNIFIGTKQHGVLQFDTSSKKMHNLTFDEKQELSVGFPFTKVAGQKREDGYSLYVLTGEGTLHVSYDLGENFISLFNNQFVKAIPDNLPDYEQSVCMINDNDKLLLVQLPHLKDESPGILADETLKTFSSTGEILLSHSGYSVILKDKNCDAQISTNNKYDFSKIKNTHNCNTLAQFEKEPGFIIAAFYSQKNRGELKISKTAGKQWEIIMSDIEKVESLFVDEKLSCFYAVSSKNIYRFQIKFHTISN